MQSGSVPGLIPVPAPEFILFNQALNIFMKKKKLELKKKVIASLSEVQKSKIIGGDDGTYRCETEYETCIDCGETLLYATCVTCMQLTCDSCETCDPNVCP